MRVQRIRVCVTCSVTRDRADQCGSLVKITSGPAARRRPCEVAADAMAARLVIASAITGADDAELGTAITAS